VAQQGAADAAAIEQRMAGLADLKRAIATAVVGQGDVVEQLLIGLLAGVTACSKASPALARRCWCARWAMR